MSAGTAASGDGITVAGHQCQFPGTGRKKPTRLWGNTPRLEAFGKVGWPTLDSRDYYTGPLRKHCGHNHNQKMMGKSAQGNFYTSPTAAYPEAMCLWIARLETLDYTNRARKGGAAWRLARRPGF